MVCLFFQAHLMSRREYSQALSIIIKMGGMTFRRAFMQVQFQDKTQANAIAEEEVARRTLNRSRLISNQVTVVFQACILSELLDQTVLGEKDRVHMNHEMRHI